MEAIGLGSLGARRRRAAARNPSACADGNEDAVPAGTNSQRADKPYGRVDLAAVLLCVCTRPTESSMQRTRLAR